jgi:release factor glutamine methyltransferase
LTVDHVETLRTAGCVFAEDEARLLAAAASGPAQLEEMVGRRAGGLPIEQVVGWAEFCGLRIAVEPGVFVPRRRTEALVDEAAALLSPGAVVVDLCCGSGAVGAALMAAIPSVELHAADLDPAAVRCARRNVERVYEGDLFEALPPALRGRVDLVAVNAPYVPSREVELLPREARLHEPRQALDGGADGLEVLRRVIAGASAWLAPEGRLVTEATGAQAPAVSEAAAHAGVGVTVVTSD